MSLFRYALLTITIVSFFGSVFFYANPFGFFNGTDEKIPYMMMAIAALCMFILFFSERAKEDKVPDLKKARKKAQEFLLEEYTCDNPVLVTADTKKNKLGKEVWLLEYKLSGGTIVPLHVDINTLGITRVTKATSTTPLSETESRGGRYEDLLNAWRKRRI